MGFKQSHVGPVAWITVTVLTTGVLTMGFIFKTAGHTPMHPVHGEHYVPILGPPPVSTVIVESYAVIDTPQGSLRVPRIG
jgi:hypothetical protein